MLVNYNTRRHHLYYKTLMQRFYLRALTKAAKGRIVETVAVPPCRGDGSDGREKALRRMSYTKRHIPARHKITPYLPH